VELSEVMTNRLKGVRDAVAHNQQVNNSELDRLHSLRSTIFRALVE